ncbi:MAG: hypothetical protein O3C54_04430 [Proteobacteria bacterium]|nr:hypothetical protein [Pseudomonadota bacterium]
MNEFLNEKIRKAKSSEFDLPKEISSQKEIMPDGNMSYVFNHASLGQVGRLIILPHPSGQAQINYEVSGSPNDPLTQKRTEIITPIFRKIIDQMNAILGSSDQSVQSVSTTQKTNKIKSMVLPCDNCNAPAAMLLHAESNTNASIEDVARLMFDNVKKLNVPTWIVGKEEKIVVDGQEGIQSLSLKIWPERQKIKNITSFELHPIFENLMQNHCKQK